MSTAPTIVIVYRPDIAARWMCYGPFDHSADIFSHLNSAEEQGFAAHAVTLEEAYVAGHPLTTARRLAEKEAE